jgi:hypothetical protein
MSSSQTITTARLVLCPLRREDGPALFALINNWNVAPWLTRVPWPYRPEDMTEFIETIALPRSDGLKPTLANLPTVSQLVPLNAPGSPRSRSRRVTVPISAIGLGFRDDGWG